MNSHTRLTTRLATAGSRWMVVVAALLMSSCSDSSDGPDAAAVDAGPDTEPRSETTTTSVPASTSVAVSTPPTESTAPTTAQPTATTNVTTTSPNESTTTIQPSTTAPIDDEVVKGWRTVTISDPDRTISEVTSFDGSVRLEASAERNFETILIYSASDDGGENSSPRPGQRPLIVWLNGLGGRASPGDPMFHELMSSGYVVATPIVPELADPAGWAPAYVEQPADVSRVIDALLDPTDGVADDLAAVIDGDRIGVGGHSIGASGAFGLAFHDCCRDERVDAVVGFGGNPVAFGFDPPGFVFTGTPLLVAHGDQDTISPIEFGESVIASADEPAYLLTVPDADHFSPIYPAGDGDAFGISWSATAAFFDQHVAGIDGAWASFIDEAPESFPNFTADLVTSARE